jgi:hypothetical protein
LENHDADDQPRIVKGMGQLPHRDLPTTTPPL